MSKLMKSLNETWEQKLQRTQEVQKEREKALEELGITVEKNNIGVHTPRKVSESPSPVILAYLIISRSLYTRCHIWSTWQVISFLFLVKPLFILLVSQTTRWIIPCLKGFRSRH